MNSGYTPSAPCRTSLGSTTRVILQVFYGYCKYCSLLLWYGYTILIVAWHPVYYDSFYSSKLLSNIFLVVVATQANFKDVRNIEGGITAYAAQVDPTVVKKT
jgi:hypothetical protein